MTAPREPRWLRLLLHMVVPREDREFVLGDLIEEFHRVARERGERRARRWYRRQVASIAVAHLTRGPAGADAWWREVRMTIRRTRRAPGYPAVAAGTLALGIAGVVAVGALAATILAPLPYPRAEDLVAVWETRQGVQRWVAPANYIDWRRAATSFEGLAAHEVRNVSITIGDVASRERVASVSGNFFDVLGVEPDVGRAFDPAMNTAFPERVAVLSRAAATRSFGGAEVALGRSFLVDDRPYRVIGVMPAGVSHPEADLFAWLRSTVEAPDAPGFPGDVTTLRDAWYFEVTGRLARGVSIESARAEMATISAALTERHPETNTGSGTRLVPLLDQTIADFHAIVLALAVAVLLILVAALFNVLHLTFARTEARRSEAAVRLSLGASGSDIRRGLLVEGWLIGGSGAVAGIWLARRALDAGVRSFGTALPRAEEIGLSLTVAVIGLCVGLAVGTFLAIVTWLRGGPGADIRSALARRAPGSALIAVQVAVSIAVATGTALLSTSFVGLAKVDLGFRTDDMTTFRVAIPDAAEHSYVERIDRYRSVAEALRALPGVTAIGLGSDAPLTMGARAGVHVDGIRPVGDPPDSGWQPVDADYFAAMGMTLLRGRRFTRGDDRAAPDVAIVNEAFVRAVLPDRDPLGARVTMGLDGHDRPLTIVGVVADTRTLGPANPPGAVLYRPLDQTTRFGARSLLFAVRSDDEVAPTSMLGAARSAAPGLPVYAATLGRELALPFRASQGTLLTIMAVFTTAALAIGAVGMYGVGTHAVRRRRREIGVRMALGATSGRVTVEVLHTALRAALLGVPPGLLLAFVVARSIDSMLFGVSSTDPRAPLAMAVGVLALVFGAFVAPARLAAGTDPALATKEP